MPLAIFAEKRNFRGLLRLSDKIIIFPWQFYRDSILRNSPYTDLKSWSNVLAENIGELDLRIASRSVFLEVLDELYNKYGFTGKPYEKAPNLSALHATIKTKKYPRYSNQEKHLQSIDIRVSGILRHCGSIFDCNYGIDLEKLLQTDFIIELDGLALEMKEFLIRILLSRIFMYYLGKGERTGKIRTLVMIDEIQKLLSRQQEIREGPFLLGQLVALAREHGVGLVCGAQNLRDLSYSLTSNCSIKIGTGFADLRDLDEFCRVV